MKIRIGWLVVGFVSLVLSMAAQTSGNAASADQLPRLVKFSGTLTDANGSALTGIVGVAFALYSEPSGGAPLWLETQNVQPNKSGHYTVLLGSTKAEGLPLDLFVSEQARWLGVQTEGQAEQPRVLLVAVPYALKANDAETVGGLPPSAFMLAAPAARSAASSRNNAAPAASAGSLTTSNVTTSGGTVNTLPLWTTATNIQSSVVTQTGSGATAKIGIGTSSPAVTLDVKGAENVGGTLTLSAAGTATSTKGYNSQADLMIASVFSKSTKKAVNQKFQLQAEPVGNNTSSPSGTLNLLFAQGSTTPVETGFSISHNGIVSFASGQTFPGTGTITGVNAGIGLVGGGTTGTVALSVDSSQVPFLTTSNGFSGTQAAFSDGGTGFQGASNSGYGVYGSSTSNDGVLGISSTGTGLEGDSSSGYGVYGSSPGNYAVVGVTTSGNGVYGQVSVAPQGGVIGRQLDSSGNWAMYAFGNIGATGTKSSVVTVDNGTRQVALYAVESPGVWFEDYGSGKLVSGVATVKIDPAYAQTVNTGVEYHVFLTPDADCEGLYVTARTATGFEVRELHQGKSNVPFDYRIIARRRGYETKRLADVTNATPRSTIETGHAGSAAGTATAK